MTPLSKTKTQLLEENRQLLKQIKRQQARLDELTSQLIRCPITNLHNEGFFHQFIRKELEDQFESERDAVLLLVNLDHLTQIRYEYGEQVGNDIIRAAGALLENLVEPDHHIFKLDGHEFAYYIPDAGREEGLNRAEAIRVAIEESTSFIQHITASICGIHLAEFRETFDPTTDLVSRFLGVARIRVQQAKRSGMNTVCFESSIDTLDGRRGRVLHVDNDLLLVELLGAHLEEQGFEALTCTDGESALRIIEEEQPDAVVSEITVPKIDGFGIRRKMLESSRHRNIPFILVANKKDEIQLQLAFDHDILFYFQKPVFIPEVIGVIRQLLQSAH